MAEHTVTTGIAAARWAWRTPAFSGRPAFSPAGWAWRTPAFDPPAGSGFEDDVDAPRGINRVVTGLEAVAMDAPPRGTHGLMPAAWGKVESFDLDDAGVDFEIRHTNGKLLASGQSSGRLTIAMTLRMPSSATLPARGDTFSYAWCGSDRTFVVWNVSPVYGLRSLRKVDVQARHELDLGNKLPVPVPSLSYPNI